MKRTQALRRSLGKIAYVLIMPAQIIILPHTMRARVLLLSGGQLLAVKALLGNGRWHLPGGGLHRGETPAAGARRELLEETGLQLPLERFADPRPMRYRNGLKQFPYHLFIIRLAETLPVAPQLPEIIECQWLDRSLLTTTNASNDIHDAIMEV